MIDEKDPFIDGLAKELKEPVRFDARFDERVMAALDPDVISIATRRAPLAPLPWYRRTFAVPAPLGGLAAAAALAGIAAIGVLATRKSDATPQVAATSGMELQPVANAPIDRSAEAQPVQFILSDSTATTVSLIGDFNDWNAGATPMTYDATHRAWIVTIPLVPGLHEYQFLVDGKRHSIDPSAPMVSGDFGSPNSVVTVKIPQ
ncbi:MAG: isoamylase early set domain-containing protein [Gemmatimonadaceae bacterium]|nr:isoamylase early set domain-containing protein [Gemmatimonadaceae bacterium]